MKNLLFSVIFLFSSSFIIAQLGGCVNGIALVTFSPIIGTNDINICINSSCCEVHHFDSYNYINNDPNHIITLCYTDTGLLIPTTITTNFDLPNANTTGIQNFTINPYFHFGNVDIGCLANTAFGSPLTLSFDAPLLQPRVFTLLSNAQFETKKLNLYPSPNNGTFSIDIPTNVGQIQVSILDLSGKEVYTNFTYYSGNLIELKNLSKGLYFAKVISSQSTETLKFIIN